MKKLSDSQLKTVRNLVSILGVTVGFALWWLLPGVFKNTSFFHVGTGEFGSKYGALVLLLLQLFAFVPADNSIEEIHTDDPEERLKLEEANKRKLLEIQAMRAIGLAVTICAVMGLAAVLL